MREQAWGVEGMSMMLSKVKTLEPVSRHILGLFYVKMWRRSTLQARTTHAKAMGCEVTDILFV